MSSDTIALDRLDELGSKAFDGFVVRKDLVRKYSKAYPVPGYVVEFLLGRYCASTDPAEIQEGLGIVEKQLVGPLRPHRPGGGVQEQGLQDRFGSPDRYRPGAARRQERLLHRRTAEPRFERRSDRQRLSTKTSECSPTASMRKSP